MQPLKMTSCKEIIGWIEEFKITLKQAKWDDSTATEVLKVLVPKEVLEIISQKRTLEPSISTILSYTYPEIDKYK